MGDIKRDTRSLDNGSHRRKTLIKGVYRRSCLRLTCLSQVESCFRKLRCSIVAVNWVARLIFLLGDLAGFYLGGKPYTLSPKPRWSPKRAGVLWNVGIHDSLAEGRRLAEGWTHVGLFIAQNST